MNLAGLFKAVDAFIAVRDAARRFTGAEPPQAAPPPVAPPGALGQIEARLANVVVAALKEAFDRDHARLELERTHIEEERRRAEAALQHELRRQAMDRELARLRLLAWLAMVGWLASVGVVAAGTSSGSPAARVLLGIGWLLLVASLGAALAAERRVAALPPHGMPGGAGAAAVWLLLAGLAATAVGLLF
ncbi:MAG: hypothetical protein A3I61_04305 [Acidobacteria bacterium RIFCSPLOWO2_02_FULL_68_18]|nr:MAG: hypothetical protein A3I61_04305 [Acidobacteria bacterium RIFCSPLOWO2_02_FULL_68_18]OFW52079.1 MAG: hypothetical protein A3G77_02950 [Acidobacteria bacterium RIFCSPLOWO2_12_FULL_68_19]